MSLQFWLDLTVCLGSHSNPPRPTNAWVLCFTVSAAWNVLFIVLCLFIYLLATLLGMCDLSSSTRDWTHDPCITVKVAQSCPHGLYRPWNSPGQNTGVGSVSLLQGIFPTQGSNPGLPHCRRIFLPAEPPEKPKNTGVGSLSLLQRIFLTQEWNQGLLQCRQILFQLSTRAM